MNLVISISYRITNLCLEDVYALFLTLCFVSLNRCLVSFKICPCIAFSSSVTYPSKRMGTIVNEAEHPLLESTLRDNTQDQHQQHQLRGPNSDTPIQRTCLESKKLWEIAGPSIFSRLAMFSITVVTQSFAGHLGDLDLAAISISCTVLISITFGFLVTQKKKKITFFFTMIFFQFF